MEVTLSQDLWDDELALIVAASADPEICHQTYLPPKMAVGEAKRWFFGQKWAYFIVHGGQPVGMVLFHPKAGKRGTVEVETWLLPEFQRKGISRAAQPLVIEEAAKWWDRMVAWVWETNTASLGLLRGSGFATTGRRYEQYGLGCVELEILLSR